MTWIAKEQQERGWRAAKRSGLNEDACAYVANVVSDPGTGFHSSRLEPALYVSDMIKDASAFHFGIRKQIADKMLMQNSIFFEVLAARENRGAPPRDWYASFGRQLYVGLFDMTRELPLMAKIFLNVAVHYHVLSLQLHQEFWKEQTAPDILMRDGSVPRVAQEWRPQAFPPDENCINSVLSEVERTRNRLH